MTPRLAQARAERRVQRAGGHTAHLSASLRFARRFGGSGASHVARSAEKRRGFRQNSSAALVFWGGLDGWLMGDRVGFPRFVGLDWWFGDYRLVRVQIPKQSRPPTKGSPIACWFDRQGMRNGMTPYKPCPVASLKGIPFRFLFNTQEVIPF